MPAAILAGLLAACGGGKSPTAAPPSLLSGPQVISLRLATGQGSAPAVSGLSATLRLPAGLRVAGADAVTGQVPASSLALGAAATGASVLEAAWSSERRELRLVFATIPTAPWAGEVARIACVVDPGAAVTEADLLALNGPPAAFKAVGVDDAAHGSVDLTAQASLSLQVVSP